MTEFAAPISGGAAASWRGMFRPNAASIEKDIDFTAPGALRLGRDVATFDPVRMARFDTFTRAIVAGVLIFTLGGAWARGFAIELGASTLGLCISAFMAIIAIVYSRLRPAPRLAAAATMLAEQMFYGVLFIFYSYVAVAFGGAEQAPLLARIDKSIGFDWFAYKALLESSPLFVEILRECYESIAWQHMLVPTALIVFARLGWARLFMNCYALGATATMLIAMLAPAIDASGLHVFDALASGRLSTGVPITDDYLALRAGAVTTLDFAKLTGIISFPSFHTYLALLYLAAAWPLRKLWFVLLPVNALLIVATPKFGLHFLADVIGGAVLAAAIISPARHWLRRQATLN